MFHEFKQLLWLETPKGEGTCLGFLDYGPEADTLFLVIQSETGELWWHPQSEVRAVKNISLYRKLEDKK